MSLAEPKKGNKRPANDKNLSEANKKKKKPNEKNLKDKKVGLNKKKTFKGKGDAKIIKKKVFKENGETEKSNEPKTEEEKKNLRLKQKQLKEERQIKSKTKDVFEISKDIKKLWEVVRSENCDAAEKENHLNDLYERVKGNLLKVIFAHDTVRVIECLISLGSDEIREKMFKEVQENIIPIAKSKYGHYFISKLLKYGNKEIKNNINKCFESKISELMKHKIANNVVEEFYNEYANANQRNGMLQEFCGPEYRLFKEKDVRTVPELIAKDPAKKNRIVHNLGANVSTLITKGCYNHSLIHTVIYNYLQVCSKESRAETIQSLREACVHVLHSHDGARLSMICLWHGTAKDRKAIVKSFKTFVQKICLENHGYLVLLALFDSVDDTKLVSKAIIGEIIENLETIAESESGRKVIMYILGSRDTKYFHPDVISNLKQGDDNEHSKKDAAIRRKELCEAFSPAIIKHTLSHMNNMFYDNPLTVYLACVFNHATNAEPLFKHLAEECTKPFVKGDDEPNLVETPATHKMIKKIISEDKTRSENGSVTFSEIVLDAFDDDTLESWVSCNRGCFLLLNMMETEVQSIQEKVLNQLKKTPKLLKAQKTKGAELLRKKIN